MFCKLLAGAPVCASQSFGVPQPVSRAVRCLPVRTETEATYVFPNKLVRYTPGSISTAAWARIELLPPAIAGLNLCQYPSCCCQGSCAWRFLPSDNCEPALHESHSCKLREDGQGRQGGRGILCGQGIGERVAVSQR